jgi:hypothetical protein
MNGKETLATITGRTRLEKMDTDYPQRGGLFLDGFERGDSYSSYPILIFALTCPSLGVYRVG